MIDEVAALIRTIGTQEVVSRFRSLSAGDIDEKSPGDLVTVADRECERVLAGELRAVRDLPVVGEEAAETDPGLIDRLSGASGWVVDPVDGTSNFVAGSTDFVVMVALVEAGETTHAWIWHPDTDRMLVAERGAGAWSNGERVTPTGSRPNPAKPTGLAKTKYIPEPARSRVRSRLDGPGAPVELLPDRGCAGLEYGDIVDGRSEFLFYWRTKPWDHAPGTLIASEAGLRVEGLDGRPYLPGPGTTGLLTGTPAHFDTVAATLDPNRS